MGGSGGGLDIVVTDSCGYEKAVLLNRLRICMLPAQRFRKSKPGGGGGGGGGPSDDMLHASVTDIISGRNSVVESKQKDAWSSRAMRNSF